MTDRLTDEQITKAVAWWTSKLNSTHFDNGDSENGVFAVALTLMKKKPVSKEQEKKFGDSLRKSLQLGNPGSFGVDYDPDPILCDALSVAGIPVNKSSLPWKTKMWFPDGKVMVAEGYGSSETEI